MVHAVATVYTIGHQTYLVFMRVIVLHRGMLPGIVGSINHKCVASCFMFFNVLVYVLAEQGIAEIIPVSDVEKTAGPHGILLGRRLEPAELRAVLVRPLPGRVVLLYFGVGEGFAVVLLGFELGVLVDFFDLSDQVFVLYFLHQVAQIGSIAILDLFDELISEEEREVAVVDRDIGVHGRQNIIP